MIAPSVITVTHGKLTVRLRPSLGAAYRLDHKHQSIGYIIRGIQEMNVGVMADVLAETSDDILTARRLLMAKVDANGVRDLGHLIDPLITLILASYGIDLDAKAEKQHRPAGKPFEWRTALEEAFSIATGFLGWPPQTAWDATPAEIASAYKGHVAKLKAIYGTKDDEGQQQVESDPRDLPTDAEIKSNIAKLKAEALRGKR